MPNPRKEKKKCANYAGIRIMYYVLTFGLELNSFIFVNLKQMVQSYSDPFLICTSMLNTWQLCLKRILEWLRVITDSFCLFIGCPIAL